MNALLWVHFCKKYSKEEKKLHVRREDVQEFWHHWCQHGLPPHPAAHDANSNSGIQRVPIGVSGDDAKYTLAGSKFILVMISSVLYKVKRH